jgi:uncharacterized paraquat-inducible protein A
MSSIALQRCWNHGTREAIARCPECGRSYCRECVVEHEDRIICNSCLAKLTQGAAKAARKWSALSIARFAAAFAGILVAWFVFFSLGRSMLSIPDDWHAEEIWEKTMLELMEIK